MLVIRIVLVQEPPLSSFLLSQPASASGHWGRRPSPPYFYGIAAASAAVGPPKKEKEKRGVLCLYRKSKEMGIGFNSFYWFFNANTIFRGRDQSQVGAASQA